MKSKIYPLPSYEFLETDNLPEAPKSIYRDVWKRVRIKLITSLRISKMISEMRENPKDQENILCQNNTIKKLIYSKNLLEFETDHLDLNDFPKYLFNPNSGFIVYWNVFLGLCLLYTAFATPFLLAFVTQRNFDIWFVIDIVLTGVFILDLMFTFNTAYHDSDGRLVTDRVSILVHYLKTWFIIDFISCFPFDLIDYSFNTEGHRKDFNNISKLAKLKNVPRLLRLSKILVLLKGNKFFPLLDNIYLAFSISHLMVNLIKTLCKAFMILHIVSCLWHYLACLYDFSPETWIFRSSLQDKPIFSLYLISVYWSLTTFTTIGYGDITPRTTGEILLTLTWMVTAIYFLCFVISSLSSMLSQQDSGRKGILDKKLKLLDIYTEDNKLPNRVKNSIEKHLKESSEKNLYQFSEIENLLNEFPAKLRYDIANSIHKRAYECFSIFRNREERFIYTIIPLMRTEKFEKGQSIYMEGEQFKDIYFMMKGKAFYINSEDVKFKVINPGGYFGDLEVIRGINRMFSVKLTENSTLWILQNEVVERIKIEFPMFYKEFEVETERRLWAVLLELAEMSAINLAKAQGIIHLDDIRKIIADEYKKNLNNLKINKEEENDLSNIDKKLVLCDQQLNTNWKISCNIEDLFRDFIEGNCGPIQNL